MIHSRQTINQVAGEFLCEPETGDYYDAYIKLKEDGIGDDPAKWIISVWDAISDINIDDLVTLIESAADKVEETHNLASASIVIGFHLGYHKIKLGNEGLMLHYDLIQQIASAFCVKYPWNYNWEYHRDVEGRDDWDIECEIFADAHIKEHDLYTDTKYYSK